jgi:hypothetical protein
LQVQSELLSKTKLNPDTSIRFPDKNKLKRRGKLIYMWRYAVAAAIVIMGLTIVFQNISDKKQNETVAQKSLHVKPVVTPSANDKAPEKKVLADNKKPGLQFQSKKKSIEKKKVSEQPEQIITAPTVTPAEISIQPENIQLAVESIPAVETVKPTASTENTFDYSEIFTEAEWKELQDMSTASELSRLQHLAKAGINRLGELTGVHLQFPNKEKQQDVFAFSVGNFEVRHVSAK